MSDQLSYRQELDILENQYRAVTKAIGEQASGREKLYGVSVKDLGTIRERNGQLEIQTKAMGEFTALTRSQRIAYEQYVLGIEKAIGAKKQEMTLNQSIADGSFAAAQKEAKIEADRVADLMKTKEGIKELIKEKEKLAQTDAVLSDEKRYNAIQSEILGLKDLLDLSAEELAARAKAEKARQQAIQNEINDEKAKLLRIKEGADDEFELRKASLLRLSKLKEDLDIEKADGNSSKINLSKAERGVRDIKINDNLGEDNETLEGDRLMIEYKLSLVEEGSVKEHALLIDLARKKEEIAIRNAKTNNDVLKAQIDFNKEMNRLSDRREALEADTIKNKQDEIDIELDWQGIADKKKGR